MPIATVHSILGEEVQGDRFRQATRSSAEGETARTPEKIDAAANILRENNRISTRKLATAIGTSHVTAWKICKKDLQMIPYKLQITQALSENDPQQRIKFCQDMLETFTGFKNIIFSDDSLG